jgi:Fe-S-cluster containining protein
VGLASVDDLWGEELREVCRRCLRCCYGTEMILLREDIERLEGLGFRGFYEVRGGFARLRNVGGRCFFLDLGVRGCLVYPGRPLGCRIYPLIYDEGLGAVLDPECPLVGRLPRRWVDWALRELGKFLRSLEVEYGYRVDWALFRRSALRLLRSSTR